MTSRVLRWALMLASAGLVAATAVLALTNAERPSKGATIVSALAALSFPVVGFLIARSQPKNPIGWLFLVSGLAVAWGGFMEEVVRSAAKDGNAVGSGVLTVFALASGWWAVGLGCLLVLSVLLFPDGHLLSPKWQIAVWLEVIAIGLIVVAGPLSTDATEPHPNPLLVSSGIVSA